MKKIVALTLVCMSLFVSSVSAQTPTKWSGSVGLAVNTSMSLNMTDVSSGLTHSSKIGVIVGAYKGKSGVIMNINSANAVTMFYTYALPKDRTVYVVGVKSFMHSGGYVGTGAMQKVGAFQTFVEVGTSWHNSAPSLSVGVLLPVTVFRF